MSKTILPFIQGASASAAVLESVSRVLAKTAPKVDLLPLQAAHARSAIGNQAVVLATSLTSEEIARAGIFHSTITSTSQALETGLSPEYKGINISVVRSILPDSEPVALRFRDRMDVLSSFNLELEKKFVTENMIQTVERAVQIAAEKKATLTLIVKSVSRYEKLNALFVEIATGIAAKAGVTLEVTTTPQLHNRLVMFPERLSVVLANDVPHSDLLEGTLLGLAGGAGVSYKVLLGCNGLKAYMGAESQVNPTGTLSAAAQALDLLGFKSEAQQTSQVLLKAIQTISNRTTDLGGKISTEEFAKVLLA